MHPTPQESVVPELTSKQIEELTDIVFLPIVAEPCDAIFIFGGTYPGHWQQAIVAYHKGYGTRVIVTGGVKRNAFRHPTWPDTQMPEADGISRIDHATRWKMFCSPKKSSTFPAFAAY